LSGPALTADASTFTGRKLDWLKSVAYDRRLLPYDFEVAFVIAQHINQKTWKAMLSDDAIADETGGGSTRNVLRARKRLRGVGWLNWHRTRTANVYRLLFDGVDRTLDMITASRDARRERHQRYKAMTPESHLDEADMTPRSL